MVLKGLVFNIFKFFIGYKLFINGVRFLIL